MGKGIGAIAVAVLMGFGMLPGTISPGQVVEELLDHARRLIGEALPDGVLAPSADGPRTAQGAPAPPSVPESRQRLAGLAVSPGTPGGMSGYSREAFPHWSTAAYFGWDVADPACDVRDAALIRDGGDVVVGDGCSVESGEWLDPYTGNTYTDPSDIDIDHVVPLANAWRSGASTWSAADREAYANDPGVLLAAEDDANQEKGDKGPEAWRPENEAFHCDYSRRWIDIKGDWGLSVNPQERAELSGMLDACGGG